MLFTGCRYEELKRLKQNPKWLSKESGFIYLPEEATKKAKRKFKDRYVRLNTWGFREVTNFLDKSVKLPTKQTMNENLQRWAEQSGIGTEGICSKMFRKTLESWLMTAYKDYQILVCLNFGHTETTALKHYLNLPFSDKDKTDMQEFVGGIKW
jgi:hypothetical protein